MIIYLWTGLFGVSGLLLLLLISIIYLWTGWLEDLFLFWPIITIKVLPLTYCYLLVLFRFFYLLTIAHTPGTYRAS